MMEKQQQLQPGMELRSPARTYRIERVLGQGSFGITYLATTQLGGSLGSLEMSVAVKEFFMRDINGRDGSNVTSGSQVGVYANYRRKFLREAQLLSRLKHKHIVHVLEAFEANNTVYYVMEYMKGGSLDGYITAKGSLPESETIEMTAQIGSALAYMHSHNMLHLDMKPSNVMLNESRMPVLIDFGLSKQYDANGVPESSTSVGGGTPGYAPLEQSEYQEGQGLPVTMDVYALGGTMFKMLTGVRPPIASDIMNDGFPTKELQSKGVSDKTIRIIAKAMDFRWKSRYQTVDEMLLALRTANPQIAGNDRYDDKTQLDEPRGYANATNPDSTTYKAPVQTAVKAAPVPESTTYKATSPTMTAPAPQQKPPAKSHKNSLLGLWIGLGILLAIIIIWAFATRDDSISSECREYSAYIDRMQAVTESMNRISADGIISDGEIDAAFNAVNEVVAITEESNALLSDQQKIADFDACEEDYKYGCEKIGNDYGVATTAFGACERSDNFWVTYQTIYPDQFQRLIKIFNEEDDVETEDSYNY